MLSEAEIRDRQVGPTGSTVAAMLGFNPFETPLMAWFTARGTPVKGGDDEARRVGSKLEPVIVSEYEAKTGRSVMAMPERYTITHAGVRVSAAPDGLTDDGGPVGLECKAHRLGAASDYGEEGTDEVPTHEWIQCQIGMHTSGIPRWDLAAFVDNRTRVYRIFYDRKRATKLVADAVDWWKAYVAAGVQPPPSGKERDHEVIDELHPGAAWHDTAILRAATDAEVELIHLLKNAKLTAKAAEERLEELVQRVKLAIGDGDGLESPLGRVTWRRNRDGKKVDHAAVLVDYRTRVELLLTALDAGLDARDALVDVRRGPDTARYTTTTTGARPFNTDRKWK